MLRIANASTATLNRQTGLYEQFVTVTNESSASIEAARISISGLPSVETSYNASGTNGSGIPYVQPNQALAPGSSVTIRLEYYSADRITVPQPTLFVEAELDRGHPAAFRNTNGDSENNASAGRQYGCGVQNYAKENVCCGIQHGHDELEAVCPCGSGVWRTLNLD